MHTLDKETKEKIDNLLKTIVDHFDQEDRIVRDWQLRKYRRLKLYWNSMNQIYYDASARDYRLADDSSNSDDQAYYDKPVNVFRAFLETIIAALSIQVPKIHCVPDDADNPNDITTAKAGDKIAELIAKHNDSTWYWLQALYIHCTEGMVAAYVYAKESEEYGTYETKEYKKEEVEELRCPHCQAKLEESVLQQPELLQNLADPQALEQIALETSLKNQEALEFSSDVMDEFAPGDDDIRLHSEILDKGPICPECGLALDPELAKTKLFVPRFVGMTKQPKSRICMEVYGGLYIKIANYAKKQCDTPYLIHSYETHYVNALEMYPKLKEKLPKDGGFPNSSGNSPTEQYARINPQYRNAFPEEQVTIRNTWLRPAAFNYVEEENVKFLKKHFPDGAKVCMVNDIVAEFENESLDDCWTLTRNPLSDFLCHDPLGELLVNIQDIVGDLISLTLQTIEHGIVQTWADPSIVNFEAQSQLEALPGSITPTKATSGTRNLSEAFFTTKSAALSPEIFQFYTIINQLGQFVSAAMPSIFGGSQESGSSRTASEYAMSQKASLQRLNTPWRMFTIWWKGIFGKAIPAYIKLVVADERHVQKDQNSGNYVNVWIRKSELVGKIGNIELESADQLPISDEEKAEMIMRLMELNNEGIHIALASPENLPFIRKVVKMPEFVLPGEDDRTKQYEEIQQLLQGQPIPQPPDPAMIQQAMAAGIDPATIPPIELPSIQIDPEVDNNEVEGAICRAWAVSEAGRLAKIENPAGYKNVLLHGKQHNELAMQQQMEMMQMQSGLQDQSETSAKPNKNPNPSKKKESSEIKGNSDVRTPVN